MNEISNISIVTISRWRVILLHFLNSQIWTKSVSLVLSFSQWARNKIIMRWYLTLHPRSNQDFRDSYLLKIEMLIQVRSNKLPLILKPFNFRMAPRKQWEILSTRIWLWKIRLCILLIRALSFSLSSEIKKPWLRVLRQTALLFQGSSIRMLIPQLKLRHCILVSLKVQRENKKTILLKKNV